MRKHTAGRVKTRNESNLFGGMSSECANNIQSGASHVAYLI